MRRIQAETGSNVDLDVLILAGRLEYAGLVGVRASESPLDVAEKLRFNEVLDKAPAVAGDEGLPGERAQRVQCPGYGLLACACLSGNGDGPVIRSYLSQEPEELEHLRVPCDYARVCILLDEQPFQLVGLVHEIHLSDDRFEGLLEPVPVDRAHEALGRAHLKGLYHIYAVVRDHEYLGPGVGCRYGRG